MMNFFCRLGLHQYTTTNPSAWVTGFYEDSDDCLVCRKPKKK